jgi:mannose-6-phosphate isomerase-like protein (cupin superfamily)
MGLNSLVNIEEYIESGILEMYVLGVTSAEENAEVQKMASIHREIVDEIDNICMAVEVDAQRKAIEPAAIIKPFIMSMVDYMERLSNGEQPCIPPLLNEESSVSDYSEWINRQDMYLPDDFKDFHAKIIGYSPQVTTAIVWIKNGAPEETHQRELENFLILEGSCEITIEDKVHQLAAGSYLSIPLYKKHHLTITSSIPCKIILQRIAA